ncbi:MAG: roadblock/LC7 domain-containing protein [Candidatus Lokiarchaeota archaeon]|nr:roadblock/LC7 domain-containing protein [Candidatus Lokiarchaeota archaeon]
MEQQHKEVIMKVLKKILAVSPGIRYALIMDGSGISLANVSKFQTDVNLERFGAISGTIYHTIEEQGFLIGYGKIKSQITEYDQGFIFTQGLGSAYLVVATDLMVNMGIIRGLMNKYSPILRKIIKLSFQTLSAVPEEIKIIYKEQNIF